MQRILKWLKLQKKFPKKTQETLNASKKAILAMR